MKTASPKTKQMDYLQAQRLIKKYGIPTCKSIAIRNQADILHAEKKISYPWVMKVIGSAIIHKSDVGGVKLNIRDAKEAIACMRELKKMRGSEYIVAQPLRKGIELIAGGKMDAQFGPTILIGMGGIYTEVFRDSSLRIAPVNDADIASMIHELKIFPILQGTRGQKGIDFNQLHTLLKGISRLMIEKNISELDLNPIIATPQGVEAVDVRIIEGK